MADRLPRSTALLLAFTAGCVLLGAAVAAALRWLDRRARKPGDADTVDGPLVSLYSLLYFYDWIPMKSDVDDAKALLFIFRIFKLQNLVSPTCNNKQKMIL